MEFLELFAKPRLISLETSLRKPDRDHVHPMTKKYSKLDFTSDRSNHAIETKLLRLTIAKSAQLMLLVLLAGAGATTVSAQGDIPSGTVSDSGTGPYVYDLTFSDAAGATSPIGSVWYAWVPGQFFLPSTPTSASAPTGWTATVSGDSVQYVASSAAYDISPGQSLSGFSYTANFTPAQLASAPNSGESDAYTGGLFSDGGAIFTVQAVPEPSMLALLSVGLGLWVARRRAVA